MCDSFDLSSSLVKIWLWSQIYSLSSKFLNGTSRKKGDHAWWCHIERSHLVADHSKEKDKIICIYPLKIIRETNFATQSHAIQNLSALDS